MQRIAIFASGTGTNAARIMQYFYQHREAEVSLVLSNKKDAEVLQKAAAAKVQYHSFSRAEFYDSHHVLNLLSERKIDLIVLAGFLWLIPNQLLVRYSDRIINIHPALLPKFGGKGMYGINVHKAVKAAGERETGITIHLVNEEYDRGRILFQQNCNVDQDDTPHTIAHKVQQLEHAHFAQQIERYTRTK